MSRRPLPATTADDSEGTGPPREIAVQPSNVASFASWTQEEISLLVDDHIIKQQHFESWMQTSNIENECVNPATGQRVRLWKTSLGHMVYWQKSSSLCPFPDDIHHTVCVQGMFDYLHSGQKDMLLAALKRTQNKLVVGICVTDENCEESSSEIMPWSNRISEIRNFLNPHLSGQQLTFLKNGLYLPDVSLWVMGKEYASYEKGGGYLNFIRMKKGCCPVEILGVKTNNKKHFRQWRVDVWKSMLLEGDCGHSRVVNCRQAEYEGDINREEEMDNGNNNLSGQFSDAEE